MSIRCACQNGHVLKVKDSLAGKSGLCPVCRARVDVPSLEEPRMSEEAILDLLGKSPPPPHVDPERFDPSEMDSGVVSSPSGLHKICERCGKDVPGGSHICPHCRTYIANLRDF